MELYKQPNMNTLWGTLLIGELTRNGVEYFCLAPGSRSALLSVGVALNKKARSFIHYDERGLSFHALGYVSATHRPAVLICTSGTAAANFLPAVIEASKKKLPLIVLTADRPPELRKTGADQTIDQVGLFGEYVRWHFDLPCPTEEIKPEFVLTTVDQAVARAYGSPPGPVHINCMFREPLAPISGKKIPPAYLNSLRAWDKIQKPWTEYIRPLATVPEQRTAAVARQLSAVKKGVIVVGKLKDTADQEAVCSLSQKLQWPIFPDTASGLRLGAKHKNIIPYFDQLLLSKKFKKHFKFDGVLHLGGRMTSKRWSQFVEQTKPATYIMVLNHPLRNDPLHTVTTRVETKISDFCQMLERILSERVENPDIAVLKELSQDVHGVIQSFLKKVKFCHEIVTTRLISENIPAKTGLFLASSMPIRDMDMFASSEGHPVIISANRGASGIDGTMASAAGFAKGLNKPVTLLIGDLAFLHDLNSLSMLKQSPVPVVIVVLNNNGGGIFSFLPIAQFPQVFEKYFGTPHHLNFRRAAEMFGIDYNNPKTNNDFVRVYRKTLRTNRSNIIEIVSERKQNLKIHRDLEENILKVIALKLRRRS